MSAKFFGSIRNGPLDWLGLAEETVLLLVGIFTVSMPQVSKEWCETSLHGLFEASTSMCEVLGRRELKHTELCLLRFSSASVGWQQEQAKIRVLKEKWPGAFRPKPQGQKDLIIRCSGWPGDKSLFEPWRKHLRREVLPGFQLQETAGTGASTKHCAALQELYTDDLQIGNWLAHAPGIRMLFDRATDKAYWQRHWQSTARQPSGVPLCLQWMRSLDEVASTLLGRVQRRKRSWMRFQSGLGAWRPWTPSRGLGIAPAAMGLLATQWQRRGGTCLEDTTFWTAWLMPLTGWCLRCSAAEPVVPTKSGTGEILRHLGSYRFLGPSLTILRTKASK